MLRANKTSNQTEPTQNDNDKVWVTITRTINTGNYENIKIDAGYSKTYSGKDDPIEIMDEMSNQIMELLNEKEKQIKDE